MTRLREPTSPESLPSFAGRLTGPEKTFLVLLKYTYRRSIRSRCAGRAGFVGGQQRHGQCGRHRESPLQSTSDFSTSLRFRLIGRLRGADPRLITTRWKSRAGCAGCSPSDSFISRRNRGRPTLRSAALGIVGKLDMLKVATVTFASRRAHHPNRSFQQTLYCGEMLCGESFFLRHAIDPSSLPLKGICIVARRPERRR